MENKLITQLKVESREGLKEILEYLNSRKISRLSKEKITTLFDNGYRCIRKGGCVEGFNYILFGEINLIEAPISYEKNSDEKILSERKWIEYTLDEHPDYGYPDFKMSLEVKRETLLYRRNCGTYAGLKEVGENRYKNYRNEISKVIELSPSNLVIKKIFSDIISEIYKIRKVPSRFELNINNSKSILKRELKMNKGKISKNISLSVNT